MNEIINHVLAAPVTGDGYKPWIAAVILIISVIVLVVLILASKRSGTGEDAYRDEDEESEQ